MVGKPAFLELLACKGEALAVLSDPRLVKDHALDLVDGVAALNKQ